MAVMLMISLIIMTKMTKTMIGDDNDGDYDDDDGRRLMMEDDL